MNEGPIIHTLFRLSDKSILLTSTYLYIFREVFGGPVRYIFGLSGLSILNYIPPILSILGIVLYLIDVFHQRRIHKAIFLLFVFLIFYSIYSVVSVFSTPQMLIGIYVLLPVFNGIILSSLNVDRDVFRFATFILLVSIAGVLLNSLRDFPWAGGDYEILGVKREVSRAWEYEGFSRISGFGRSSFAVANTIIVYLFIFMMDKKKKLISKFSLFILSSCAIYLTTTKTIIILLLIIPAFWAGFRILASLFAARNQVIVRIWVLASVVLFCAMVVMLPLSSAPNLVDSSASLGFFSFESFRIRMQTVWPDAFTIMAHGGNWLFGRGIGGVGVPQEFLEPDYYTFADNLFLYVYLATGAVGAAIFFSSLVAGLRYRTGLHKFELYYVLTLYILGAGMTSNTVEGPLQGIIIGVLIGGRAARGNQANRPPAPMKTFEVASKKAIQT